MSNEQPVDTSTKQDPRHELLQQMSGKIVTLGQKTLALYQQNQLSHPDLSVLCDELTTLEDQILGVDDRQSVSEPEPPVTIEEPVEFVSAEPHHQMNEDGAQAASLHTSGQTARAPVLEEDTSTLFMGTTCVTCNAPLKPSRKFCTNCGQKVEVVAQPASVTAEPSSTAGDFACDDCGTLLPAGSAFCTVCGKSVDAPPVPPAAPPPPPPATLDLVAKYCDGCGLGLPEETAVCPGCGGNTFS